MIARSVIVYLPVSTLDASFVMIADGYGYWISIYHFCAEGMRNELFHSHSSVVSAFFLFVAQIALAVNLKP